MTKHLTPSVFSHAPGHSRDRSRFACTVLAVSLLGSGGLALLGCKDLTGSQALPAGTNAPSFYSTKAGALGMRNAALYQLEQALPSFIVDAGLLTDELESNQVGASAGTLLVSSLPQGGSLDERILPELTTEETQTSADQDYANLQAVRGGMAQALGALATYDTVKADTATVKIQRGELYALNGYTEILLADFFCSGVPLSTFDFQQDFTYHASSTTGQVYQDAITQEDSALALADTSLQVHNLALVLKGRALLAQGQYAQAAQVVAAVPDSFQYQLALQWTPENNSGTNLLDGGATVSDREGGTGPPYVFGGDPRTAVTNEGTSTTGAVLYFPNRYSPTGFSPFPVANGIEARLIEAEAALQPGGAGPAAMLADLNHLRATATVPSQTAPLSTTLTDPGTDTARVSLLFQERAYWLFLSGHRQGDLRRLLRPPYGQTRTQTQVYPTGPYLAPGSGQYGNDVTAPISSREYINPNFHGCLDRSA